MIEVMLLDLSSHYLLLKSNSPVPFVVVYTTGNILSLLSSMFLCGPKRQFKCVTFLWWFVFLPWQYYTYTTDLYFLAHIHFQKHVWCQTTAYKHCVLVVHVHDNCVGLHSDSSGVQCCQITFIGLAVDCTILCQSVVYFILYSIWTKNVYENDKGNVWNRRRRLAS